MQEEILASSRSNQLKRMSPLVGESWCDDGALFALFSFSAKS